MITLPSSTVTFLTAPVFIISPVRSHWRKSGSSLTVSASKQERELLRRAIENDSNLTRMMLRVVKILHLVDHQGRPDEARKALRALREDPEFQPDAYYATQLEIITQSRQLT